MSHAPTEVDAMNVVRELEKRLLPGLQKVAEEISEQFPRVKATVWSLPVGLATDYQGYDVGIDCLLTDAGLDEVDNVALSVVVSRISTTPLIEAGVCWGHPSGHVEAAVFPDAIKVTPEIIQELETRLPLLYDALKRAVTRGHPPGAT